MPRVEFVIYAETTDSSPVIDWLRNQPEKARLKIIAAIDLLSNRAMRRGDRSGRRCGTASMNFGSVT